MCRVDVTWVGVLHVNGHVEERMQQRIKVDWLQRKRQTQVSMGTATVTMTSYCMTCTYKRFIIIILRTTQRHTRQSKRPLKVGRRHASNAEWCPSP